MSELQTPLPQTAKAGSSVSQSLGIIGALIGGLLTALSACGILAYLIVPLQGSEDALSTNTLLASTVAIGVVFGGLLLLVGITTARGKLLRGFTLPSSWLFGGLFIIFIILGQAVLTTNVGTPYLFPPWHVLASAMLPLAALAYAARRLPAVPIRSVIAQMVWGGLGTVLLSLVFELLIGALLAVGVVVVLLVVVGSQRLNTILRTLSTNPRDLAPLINLLTRDPSVLIIIGLAALLLFVVLAPLLEEIFKSLGPAFLIGRAHPTPGTALLWGLAAGAGYAFSENMLNGASGAATGGEAPLWAVAMVLRAGTSLVHMGATATVSLGWHAAIVQGRRGRLFALFFAALMAHGFWNIFALGLAAVSTFSFAGATVPINGFVGAALGIITLSILISLILASALWIVWLVRSVTQHGAGNPTTNEKAQLGSGQ